MSVNPFWPTDTPDIFDSLVHPGDVRDAVKATLAIWLATYVTEIGTRKNLTLAPVQDWKVLPEYRTLPQGKNPAVMVTCGGTVGDPVRRGDGSIGATYAVEVSVVLWGGSWEDTEDLTGYYGTAVTAALLQHPDLGGLAESVKWGGYRYAVADHSSTRTLGVGRLTFSVTVDKVLNATAGPAQPTDPTTPPPTVATVGVTVTGGTP